jgi:cation diffusion facilitator family transporter
MAAESRTAVIAAIAGNLAIAVSKLGVALLSGSAAMFSEAIHSLVDTGNGGLLLYGMHRSKLPADDAHPFGHGHELYFWSLIVGVLIFGLGGGMSIVSGVRHVIEPVEIADAKWSYAVLAIAALFEGTTWYFGWKALDRESRGRGVVETIERSKDPTSFSVVLEDSAALLGIAVAFIGIFAATTWGVRWVDGAASIAIGVLLCLVAMVMVNESRKLIVGEGMEPATLADLRGIVAADPGVERLEFLRTLYLGPEEVMLVITLHFKPGSIDEVRASIRRMNEKIQGKYPRIRRIYLEASSLNG